METASSSSSSSILPSLSAGLTKVVLIQLIIGITTSFTSRISLFRPVAIVLVIALAVSVQNSIVTWTNYQPLAAMLSLFAWVDSFTVLDLLLYSQVTYSEHMEWVNSRKGAKILHGTFWERGKWALLLPNNRRRLGTKWQITPIHTFDPSNPKFMPSRAAFLLHRLLTTVLVYVGLFYLHGRPGPNGLDILFSKERQDIMLDEYSLSMKALPSRFYLFVSFTCSIFIAQKAHYNTLSIIAVTLRLSDPVDWPPIQGSLVDCWSVRQLWGHVWHQTFRQFLSANADFITFTILRLKPRTVCARYSRFFLCFFGSAIIHALFDEACGIPLSNSGALLFFSMQPIAFAVEEVAQKLSERHNILTLNKPLRCVIGYTWVALFCTCTWPIWFFPITRNMIAQDQTFYFIHLPMVI